MDVPVARKSLTEHLKVPAWIGSILFHLFLLLVVLLFLRFRPEPNSAPGVRNATGGIVLAKDSLDGKSYVDSQNNEFGEASPLAADERTEAPTIEQVLTERFSDARIPEFKSDSAIGPRRSSTSTEGIPGGAELADALRRSGSGGGLGYDGKGGQVSVKLFGLEGKGTSFVFVFDRSGSMNEYGGKPMAAAKMHLIQSLEPLQPLHRFNFIFYNEKPIVWKPGKLVFVTDVEKENAMRFIEGIIPMGSTQHREALAAAIKLRPEVIFFLTDGDENDALSPGQLHDLERLNHRMGVGAQINVIQFGSGAHRESAFLQKLAAQNNGRYAYFDIGNLR